MLSRPARLLLPLALLLLLSLPPEYPPRPVEHTPEPGPAVRVIPSPAEWAVPEPETAPDPPPEVHVIEDCTVTWYTEATCGKSPDHPAYGITASGLLVEEGVTCAVDPEVRDAVDWFHFPTTWMVQERFQPQPFAVLLIS